MKKTFTFTLALIALVIGAGIGFCFTYTYCGREQGKFITETITNQSFLSTANAFTAIRNLRAGNTNAVVSDMERELDVGIIFFGALLQESPEHKKAKNYHAMLRRIRDYRQTYPRKTEDADFDSQVAEVLAAAAKSVQP